MGKSDYLDALKRAMPGLAPELQAKTLAWYEQRFVDGVAAGRSEADIAAELGDPKKVVLTLRTNTHLHAFAAQKNPASLLRLIASGTGLLIFNLFMLVPAAVFGSLLAALYISAFAVYVGGIAVTASSLAGANELVLNAPLHQRVDGTSSAGRTRIAIGETGIQISEEPVAAAPDTPAPVGASAGARVVRRAERVADGGIRITNDLDQDSRATQTVLGAGAVLGGIALFLVALSMTRLAALGIKRYAQMNLSLLRGS